MILILSLFASNFSTYKDLLDWSRKDEDSRAFMVVEDEKIQGRVRQEAYEQLLEEGVLPRVAEKWVKIGVVAQDETLVWVRDVVSFPGQPPRLQNRVFSRKILEGKRDKAYFVTTKKGEWVFAKVFSPALGKFFLDLLSLENLESLGVTVDPQHLGTFWGNPELIASPCEVFAVQEVTRPSSASYLVLTPQELRESLRRGVLEVGNDKLEVSGSVVYAMMLQEIRQAK